MLGINGLGRIGRLLLKRLAVKAPASLAAVNDPADLETLLALLQRDSVHGPSPLPIEGFQEGGQDWLCLGAARVRLFHETEPERIPFDALDVRLVVESSGRFTRRAEAARHLRGGVSHAVISAPSPDADFTVLQPLNGGGLDLAAHRIISNASCTAHATGPMLQVLEERFGLEHAGMSTVHVVTNDQRLQDAPHKDLRRARAAFQSIIPTSSSAFGALHAALPWLAPGFNGSALRVPTLSVNLVDITATLRRDATVEALSATFREAAAGPLRDILAIAEDDLVSRDFTGRAESVLMDLQLTRVLGGRFVKVFGWHDNETGYAARLEELVRWVSGRL
ncbi:MAG: type I glyceraldehyde-3-phosphate dehydrogenase [Holophagaceae bacterium]|nr:type I glyceraldehyde-3-phosphate dehydrogenase [Holophagaceae bacterium]